MEDCFSKSHQSESIKTTLDDQSLVRLKQDSEMTPRNIYKVTFVRNKIYRMCTIKNCDCFKDYFGVKF